MWWRANFPRDHFPFAYVGWSLPWDVADTIVRVQTNLPAHPGPPRDALPEARQPLVQPRLL